MEDFVTEIQSKIGTQSSHLEKKSSKFRDLFAIIVSSSPEVKILEKCSDEGDVMFECPIRSLGINYELLMKYKTEITSDFTANFLGELLIRENMDKFAKILTDLKDDYIARVNQYEHRKFGMKIFRDRFIFTFHISLIQSILTESFKKKMH